MKTSMREEQAYNDGRLAFREGKSFAECGRRSAEQRAAWQRGFEFERGLATAEKASPAQLDEARRVVGKLKEWAKML